MSHMILSGLLVLAAWGVGKLLFRRWNGGWLPALCLAEAAYAGWFLYVFVQTEFIYTRSWSALLRFERPDNDYTILFGLSIAVLAALTVVTAIQPGMRHSERRVWTLARAALWCATLFLAFYMPALHALHLACAAWCVVSMAPRRDEPL